MVTCRCGREFENPRQESHVMCPGCRRIYANTAPEMFHPRTEEEKRWKCSRCGRLNEPSHAGQPSRECAVCGTVRPGNPRSWYGP